SYVLNCSIFLYCCFFFQAEDGIRDLNVTGVQTCALPLWFTLKIETTPILPDKGLFESSIPAQRSLYGVSLGISNQSSPSSIFARSVLKPWRGFFLERNLGLPQSGCALLKKFCHALPKSWIANCKVLAE